MYRTIHALHQFVDIHAQSKLYVFRHSILPCGWKHFCSEQSIARPLRQSSDHSANVHTTVLRRTLRHDVLSQSLDPSPRKIRDSTFAPSAVHVARQYSRMYRVCRAVLHTSARLQCSDHCGQIRCTHKCDVCDTWCIEVLQLYMSKHLTTMHKSLCLYASL